MLINYKSAQKGDVSIEYDDVKALATEGTRWSDPQINNPRVVQAMIDNAFATAVAATKSVLANQTEGGKDESSRNSQDQHASRMISNSATIISAAIDSYSTSILNSNQTISAVFEQAWDLIPVSHAIPKAIEETFKATLLRGLKESFNKKHEFGDIVALKKEYESKFQNILSILDGVEGINYATYAGLKNDFDID